MSTEYKDAFETIQKSDHFTEFKLKSNGLRVVIIPHPSVTNTLSCTMVYHVGSYDERIGYTGSTHLLVSHPYYFLIFHKHLLTTCAPQEHLLFKDPLVGAKQNIFQLLDKHGATINGKFVVTLSHLM